MRRRRLLPLCLLAALLCQAACLAPVRVLPAYDFYVFNAKTGEPIAGAGICVSWHRSGPAHLDMGAVGAESDAHGRVRIPRRVVRGHAGIFSIEAEMLYVAKAGGFEFNTRTNPISGAFTPTPFNLAVRADGVLEVPMISIQDSEKSYAFRSLPDLPDQSSFIEGKRFILREYAIQLEILAARRQRDREK